MFTSDNEKLYSYYPNDMLRNHFIVGTFFEQFVFIRPKVTVQKFVFYSPTAMDRGLNGSFCLTLSEYIE